MTEGGQQDDWDQWNSVKNKYVHKIKKKEIMKSGVLEEHSTLSFFDNEFKWLPLPVQYCLIVFKYHQTFLQI